MTMLLRGRNEEFELALIENRFPDVQDDSDGATWLTLLFRVGTADDAWEETAPCMNVFEVSNLAEWLEAVADGLPDIGEVDILEPELNFSVAREFNGEVSIRVRFQLEDRPPEFSVDAPTDRDHIDIRLSRDQIRTAAAQLRRDLESISDHAARDRRSGEEESELLGEPEENLGLIPPEVTEGLDENDDDRMF